MARKRLLSKTPFPGLGLDEKETKLLEKLLEKKELSLQKLKRYLIREWIKQQTDPNSGLLKLNGL